MSLVVYTPDPDDPASGQPKRLHEGSPKSVARARTRMATGEACIEGDYATIIGKRVEGGALVDVVRTSEDDMRDLRAQRDKRLSAHVDTMNPIRWETMTEAQRKAWRDYRQALLNLPETATDPRNPVWPARPE